MKKVILFTVIVKSFAATAQITSGTATYKASIPPLSEASQKVYGNMAPNTAVADEMEFVFDF